MIAALAAGCIGSEMTFGWPVEWTAGLAVLLFAIMAVPAEWFGLGAATPHHLNGHTLQAQRRLLRNNPAADYVLIGGCHDIGVRIEDGPARRGFLHARASAFARAHANASVRKPLAELWPLLEAYGRRAGLSSEDVLMQLEEEFGVWETAFLAERIKELKKFR
eukprot:SAG22_NODE_1429_length_4441_cov_39.877476_1_plen_163_part_00